MTLTFVLLCINSVANWSFIQQYRMTKTTLQQRIWSVHHVLNPCHQLKQDTLQMTVLHHHLTLTTTTDKIETVLSNRLKVLIQLTDQDYHRQGMLLRLVAYLTWAMAGIINRCCTGCLQAICYLLISWPVDTIHLRGSPGSDQTNITVVRFPTGTFTTKVVLVLRGRRKLYIYFIQKHISLLMFYLCSYCSFFIPINMPSTMHYYYYFSHMW